VFQQRLPGNPVWPLPVSHRTVAGYNARMARHNWIVLTALNIETKAIVAELGPETPVQTIGIKAKHINPDQINGAQGLILAGVCGALDPALSIGDIVFDAPRNGPWQNLPLARGRIYTADHLITTIAEKKTLFESTRCPAVDMEGQIVRDFADAAKIPFLHLRAVSDCADEALPDRMSNWIDDFGEPRMTQIAADLAFRAYLIPTLMRLQKNTRLALTNVAKALKQIVDCFPE
jgi:adenosylhomocysteine nucleosidase